MDEQTTTNTNEPAEASRPARPEERPAERPDAGTPTPQALWAIGDVAEYLQLPTSSIYKMTARKAAIRIPHIRIGGTLRFRKADIDRWLSLLTVSNLDTLTKVRTRAPKGHHGYDP